MELGLLTTSLQMLLAREEIWLCSSEVHPLERKMQGPMASIKSWDLEQRQVRSAASQPMLLAAVSRQPRAHSGSWLTKLGRSLLDAVAAVPVEVGLWATVEAIRTAAAVRPVMICMLGRLLFGVVVCRFATTLSLVIGGLPCGVENGDR